MNTEALKKLGLTQEQIDAIMAENGKDIKAEQDKAEGLKKERDSLQSQLSEANETIKGYKDMDIDAIKKSADDWEDKYKASVKELEDMRFDNLLDKGLTGSGAYDADIVKKLLDREALIVKDGKLEGLDKQLAHMQEKRPTSLSPRSRKHRSSPQAISRPGPASNPLYRRPVATAPAGKAITPACAGNARTGIPDKLNRWDHPRVCGEYLIKFSMTSSSRGSPPRVRGIRRCRCSNGPVYRITPACAGNTPCRQRHRHHWRDHPRVCGEYRKRNILLGKGTGITPACAGNTEVWRPG